MENQEMTMQKNNNCDNCERLNELRAENRKLKKEQDIMFLLLDLGMSAVELWAENNGLLGSKEDAEETFADGNDKIRMFLDQIGESGKNPRVERFASLLKSLQGLKQLL